MINDPADTNNVSSTTREISIEAGVVMVVREPVVLRSSPLGSCVAVAAYDPHNGVGAMAHVMLPGRCLSNNADRKTLYAEAAVCDMVHKVKKLGAATAGIHVFLVGGADVLGNGHGSPGPEIIQSVTGILDAKGLRICASHIGGTERRSCILDTGRARVTYTVGDSEQRLLWEVARPRPACHAVAQRRESECPVNGQPGRLGIRVPR